MDDTTDPAVASDAVGSPETASARPVWRSPVLDSPGAVDASEGSPDAGVPLHFGDPLGEQRAATTGPVVVDRSHRDVLEIGGAERLTWLEGFVSQHVSELADGAAAETLVLDANGRVEHHALVAESQELVTLDTEAGRGADLLAFLARMVFWADADPRESELRILTLTGADLPPLLRTPGGEQVTLPTASGAPAVVPLPGGGRARRTSGGPEAVDLFVPADHLDAWFSACVAAGARPAGSWAWEALRVTSDGDRGPRARIGLDTDDRTIPHEVPAWIGATEVGGAVHLDKGCYRGQETVARVHNLGRSPRVLVRLQLDGSAESLPAPGEALELAGRPVGRVGTVVHHHEDGPVALALLKRSVPADAELTAAGVAAAIDPATVPGEVAPQAGREAVRRLRGG